MPLLEHRRTNLRDLPPDLIGEHDQAIFLKCGRVMLELGNCRHRSVRNQLQHQMLFVAEAEGRWRQGRRGQRKERLRSERHSFRRACGGLLPGASMRPSGRSPARTLASRSAGPRRGSSLELQAVRALGCRFLDAVGRGYQMCRVRAARASPIRGRAGCERRDRPSAISHAIASTPSHEPGQSAGDALSEVPGDPLGRDRVEPRLLHAGSNSLALRIDDLSIDFRKRAE